MEIDQKEDGKRLLDVADVEGKQTIRLSSLTSYLGHLLENRETHTKIKKSTCLGLWVQFPVSGDERLSRVQLGAGRSQEGSRAREWLVYESVRGAHKGQKCDGKLHCQGDTLD